MSENLEVIKGYYEAIKKNRNPKAFIQLSYVAHNQIGKDLWKVHAELVKGKETKIEIIREINVVTPFIRTVVHFTLNGILHQVVIVKESKPVHQPELLYNWVDTNGKAGLNPCSIRKI